MYLSLTTAGTNYIIIPKGVYDLYAIGGAGGGAARYSLTSTGNTYNSGSFCVASGGSGGAVFVSIRVKSIARLTCVVGGAGQDTLGLLSEPNPRVGSNGGESYITISTAGGLGEIVLCRAFGGKGGEAGSTDAKSMAGYNVGSYANPENEHLICNIRSRNYYNASGTTATFKKTSKVYYLGHSSAASNNPISTGAHNLYPSGQYGKSAGISMYKNGSGQTGCYVVKDSNNSGGAIFIEKVQ